MSGVRITPIPDSHDPVETRLVILEQAVARLREQSILTSSDAAAAARVLAAGADRDGWEVS